MSGVNGAAIELYSNKEQKRPAQLHKPVVQGLADGKLQAKIAEELGVSVITVNELIRKLRNRYGVTNRTALVAYFLRRKWIE